VRLASGTLTLPSLSVLSILIVSTVMRLFHFIAVSFLVLKATSSSDLRSKKDNIVGNKLRGLQGGSDNNGNKLEKTIVTEGAVKETVYQELDKDSPPDDMPKDENGKARYEGWASAAIEVKCVFPDGSIPNIEIPKNKEDKKCTVDVQITKIELKPTFCPNIYHPPVPGDTASDEVVKQFETILAHEEGHVKIMKVVWELVMEVILCELVDSMKTKIQLKDLDPCTEENVIKAWNERSMSLLDDCGTISSELIRKTVLEVSGRLDDVTNHALNGPPDSDGNPTEPTAKNQEEAACDIANKYKEDFDQKKFRKEVRKVLKERTSGNSESGGQDGGGTD